VQSALREMPEATRLVLVEMLSTTLEMLGTSNGLKTEKAIAIAAKRLTDEFGHFTIEDWRLCLYEMEAGRSVKHYNNTNLEWLINCFQAYDERKVEVMRQIHSEAAQVAQRQTATMYRVDIIDPVGAREPVTLASLIAQSAPGEVKVTHTIPKWEEREERARRDVARHNAAVASKVRAMARAQVRAKRKDDGFHQA
jgi:hypothetical protein